MTERPAVGVVGASARAAVMSLARAGYAAWAVDLFTDRDLGRIAPCARCPIADYPGRFLEFAVAFPPGPVIYTGGLENAPDVVGDLARRRPLWGNGADVLNRVREPATLVAGLIELGLPTPGQIPAGKPVPSTGRWLRKADRSSGGGGVRVARPGEPIPTGYTAQEQIAGPTLSAQYVSAAGRTVLLGVTQQLAGEDWLHAKPFAYCGNIGPVNIPDGLRGELSAWGETVGRWGGLRGLWGVDFILSNDRPYPVDLNPRYTAALEILEHARGSALLAGHVAAFQFPESEPDREGLSAHLPGNRTVGKAIYFAPEPITFPPEGPWDADLMGEFDPWRLPGFADIPPSGDVIPAGSPVLTFFAADSTPAGCRAKLEQRAAELDRLFHPTRSGPKAEPERTHDAE